MIEIYTLITGIILCALCLMVLIWTRNFIVLRFEAFQKLIRKAIEVKYKKLNIFFASLYFITAIPLLTIAIIGFITIVPDKTYIWIYLAIAGFGVIGILYANISKQFIQPLDQEAETAI